MSLKGNFYQALRELLNHGGLVGSDLETKAKTASNLDSYLETPKVTPEQGATEAVNPSNVQTVTNANADKESVSSNNFWDVMAERKDSSSNGQDDKSASAQSQPVFHSTGSDESSFSKPPEEMTIISKNSFVEGNIRSFANVTIEGGVRGKVDVMKNVSMQGVLVGNLTCNNADMQGSSIQGNVFTKGNVFVDNDSVLLGDMVAQYASVDGKVRGNMQVGSKTEFHANAIILGDVKTGTISVADGANIQGFINTAYLMEHGDTAFPNEVVIDDMGN
jgi:cytoskeletal protein CcmA (bactofilin family)